MNFPLSKIEKKRRRIPAALRKKISLLCNRADLFQMYCFSLGRKVTIINHLSCELPNIEMCAAQISEQIQKSRSENQGLNRKPTDKSIMMPEYAALPASHVLFQMRTMPLVFQRHNAKRRTGSCCARPRHLLRREDVD